MSRVALLALVILGSPAPASASGAVVDRIVAVVDGQVLTQSELEFEARVALIEQGGAEAASLALDAPALHGALQWAIAERVEANEADRLHAFTVDDAEVVARLQKFEARFPSHEAYERFLDSQEVDESQLAEVLARSLRAEKVLDSKVRLRARVTEEAIRAYYEAHHAEFTDYESARAPIRDLLMRERYQALVAQELTQQRAGSNVRILVPFGPAGAGAGEGAP